VTSGSSARRANNGELRPDRAVIDIGSNTVRLVVYTGSRRAPSVDQVRNQAHAGCRRRHHAEPQGRAAHEIVSQFVGPMH
jgi:hypothetical protein